MATAIFNQEISASSIIGEVNEYDLTKVLTLSGFDIETLGFTIVSSPSDSIIIKDNILLVGYGVYGTLTINVYDKIANSINVSTNIKISYGYFFERYFDEKSNVRNNIKTVQSDWSKIVSNDDRKPVKDKEDAIKR